MTLKSPSPHPWNLLMYDAISVKPALPMDFFPSRNRSLCLLEHQGNHLAHVPGAMLYKKHVKWFAWVCPVEFVWWYDSMYRGGLYTLWAKEASEGEAPEREGCLEGGRGLWPCPCLPSLALIKLPNLLLLFVSLYKMRIIPLYRVVIGLRKSTW